MTTSKLQATVVSKAAIIFDLFHTLTALEITSGGHGQGRRSYDILGVTRVAWDDQLLLHSRDRIIGRLREPIEIIRGMAHAIDPSISQEKIQMVVDRRSTSFQAALREMPVENCNAISKLKMQGKKIALLSNADVMEASGWHECPAAALFDVTMFSCFVGCAKPEEKIYHQCLNELGVQPHEAIFVGDGGSDELAGAKKVGMTTVMMTGYIKNLWPERIPPRKKFADFVIESLSEIVPA